MIDYATYKDHDFGINPLILTFETSSALKANTEAKWMFTNVNCSINKA